MGIIRKWIHSLSVPVDEETGEPSVHVSGITFDKDIDIGDVSILDAAGTKINPATAEGVALVAAPLGATTDAPVGDLTTVENATARTGISLWKRIVNFLVSFSSRLPAALGAGGGIKVDGSGTALPISGEVTVSGAATETTLGLLTGAGLTFVRKQLVEDGGTVVIVAAAQGVTARIHGFRIVCDTATTLTFKDSDANTLSVLGSFSATGGIVVPNVAEAVLADTEAPEGQGISLVVSAGTVSGQILYSTE